MGSSRFAMIFWRAKRDAGVPGWRRWALVGLAGFGAMILTGCSVTLEIKRTPPTPPPKPPPRELLLYDQGIEQPCGGWISK